MMDPPYIGPKMEARRSSGSTFVEAPRELELDDLDEEARVYGSRWVEVEGKDGRVDVEEVPLTWKDLFDPQEGDRLMQGYEHGDVTSDTRTILKCLFKARGRDDMMVYDDVRIDWKTPRVPPACPDIAVIPGMSEERARQSDVFDERKEGTSPCFILEVTSKKTARYDRTNKPSIYRRGKVRERFQLDRLKSPWKLDGERRNLKTRRYRKLRPDKQGRLLAETLDVYFSISASGNELILEDAKTGEVLRKPVQESEDRRAAEQRAAEEAEARQKEAEAREAAERQAAEEAKARRKEAKARRKEAKAREKEAKAREAAERQAAEEAEAREAAEAKVQELLAKIERLESSAD